MQFFKGKKKIGKIIIFFTTAVLTLSSFPAEAFAGTFTHVHTSACNKEVKKTCKHYLVYGAELLDKHCPSCGTIKQCTIEGYTDICPLGLVESEYTGFKIYCNSCGYVFEDRGTPTPHTHEYTVKERACGKKDSTDVASVSV